MEAIILSRIHDLLTYRRWFRTHRWADWPQERHDYDVELRALVRLARAARRIELIVDHPADATWDGVREVDPEFNPGYVMGPGDEVPYFDPDWREGQPEFNGAFR